MIHLALALACSLVQDPPSVLEPLTKPVDQSAPSWLPPGSTILHILWDDRPDHFGWGTVRLGDVDGDGTGDVYVGARAGVFGLTQLVGYGDVFSGRTGERLYRLEGQEDPEGDAFGVKACRVADIDGDGASEIAIKGEAMSSWQTYVKLFSGRTGSLIRTWGEARLGFDPGDLDGDGHREMVLLSKEGSTSVVPLEEGGLAFGCPGEPIASTGDLDRDGARDLLTSGGSGLGFSRGDGIAAVRSGRDGHSLLQIPDPSKGLPIYRLAKAGDVDGDSFTDLVVVFYDGPRTEWRMPAHEKRFRIVLLSGKHGSVLRDTWEDFGGIGDIHDPQDVSDFDGDGRSDLFIARFLEEGEPRSRARIYSGKDGSVLVEMTSEDWSFGVSACNAGDLDGDGRPELLVGEHEYGGCAGRAYLISFGKRR
jgi:hypothetical protein